MGPEIVETVIYLTNIVICAIIATLVTDAWRRGQHHSSMRYWMIAAWIMLAADILFASRPLLPPSVGRTLPTLLVTMGQATLLVGARIHSELPSSRRLAFAFVLSHAVLLFGFYYWDPSSPLRRISNGLIWATLAFMSAQALRQSTAVFWSSFTSPAKVFLAHGSFHLVRLGLGFLPVSESSELGHTFINIIGDLEVSFFMVALFVGLLIAHLKQRNEALTSALAEVQTLSGLLPICAWCKKVRDDDGYWKQVEDYFRSHSQIRFSHGMCNDCADEFRKDSTDLTTGKQS